MNRRMVGRGLSVLALLAAVAWAAWHFLAPLEVRIVQPGRGPAVQAVYATGVVEAGVTVRIAPRTAGRLIALQADEGAHVSAGQVLAQLDAGDLRATVAELEARQRYAEQRLQRTKALYQKGFINRDNLQQAQSEADAAHAALRRARAQQGFMTIKAPADGRIIRRDGEVGDFIPVNQPLFFLATADAARRIEAEVDEEDIARVRVGQKALLSAGAFPDRVFDGRVAQITPQGDPVSRSYRVRIQLPDDTPLMIGMTMDVNIIVTRRENALLVPSSAVADDKLWLVRDGRLVQQQVQTGVRGAQRTEILSGIADDAAVVAQPTPALAPGKKVRAHATQEQRP